MEYKTRITEIDIELVMLEDVIKKRKQEREALLVLANMQQDDVEVTITQKNVTAPTKMLDINSVTEFNDKSKQPRKSSYKTFVVELIAFLNVDGKPLKPDVINFFESHGRSLGHPEDPYSKVRTDLWKIKTTSGFIDNPDKGFYRATTKGMNFVATQKGEGSSADNTTTFNLQPSPVQGATD